MANESGGMRVAKFYACYVGCNALEDLKECEIYIKKKKKHANVQEFQN